MKRRQVFHIAGYDPTDPDKFCRRFTSQLEIFKTTWGIGTVVSQPRASSKHWDWRIDTAGPNWNVHSDFQLWLWDDIVRADAASPEIVRLAKAAIAYLDLLFTGTLYRYAKASYRYFMFAIIPPLEVLLFMASSFLGAWLIAELIGFRGFAAATVTFILAIAAFFLLLHWLGRHWRVQHALDGWIFARDYILGGRPDIEPRLDHFADALVASAKDDSLDEIVIVGHSFGATFAIEVAARALERDPEFGRHRASVNILTVGATIPKCTLHPAAQRIRERVRQVVDAPAIHWVECQTRGDPITFDKFHPALLRRIGGNPLTLDMKPMIRRVQLHDVLQPGTLARNQLRVLRLHYQSVMANDRRAHYDYFLMACGPVSFAAWAVSPRGQLDFLRMDGSVGKNETSKVEQ